MQIIPSTVKVIIFLEEGIKNGGAGMILRDMMMENARMNNVTIDVLAIDDSFAVQKKGETAYESAGISRKHIVFRVKEMLNNM